MARPLFSFDMGAEKKTTFSPPPYQKKKAVGVRKANMKICLVSSPNRSSVCPGPSIKKDPRPLSDKGMISICVIKSLIISAHSIPKSLFKKISDSEYSYSNVLI